MLIDLKLIDADNDILATVNAGLFFRCRFFNPQLGYAALYRLSHATEFIDLCHQLPRFIGHIVRQMLHHVGAPPGVHYLPDAGLLLQYQLGVTGDAGSKIGWQRDCLVQSIGVQRLCPTKDRGHRLNRGTDDIVVGVLLSQRPTRGLAMSAEHAALGVCWPEFLDDLCPQQSGSPHLRDFHIKVHANTPEEAEAWRKVIDLETSGNCRLNIFLPIGEGIGQLKRRVGTRLLHVIARNGDGVEFRQMRGAMSDDVPDNPHARSRRIDIGVADHKLLQNVILNSA